MKPLSKYFIIASIGLLLFLSCKSPKLLDQKNLKPMPESFTGTKDSANSADINWRKYFSDPDLQVLIDEGLKNNQDMLIALQRIEGARSEITQNKGALFPTLNANAYFWQRKFGYYTMDDAGNRVTEIEPGKVVPTHLPDYYLGLQTSWEIDVWGKLRNKKKAALARYFSSVEGKNLVITNLIADITNNYYELLALDNKLGIIKETIQLQTNAAELVSIQRQAGTANELAVKQFKAQLNNSKALEYEIMQEITECENRINFLLGRYPSPVKRDKASLNKELSVNPKIGLPAHLLKNRPDIRQAEFEMMAAKADVKAAKAAFYPSLNITGSLGFQGYQAVLLFTNPQSLAYSLLGNLVAPLTNRSAIKAQFQNANSAQLESFYNYQKSILNGYVEVYNEMERIRNLDSIAFFKTQEVLDMDGSVEISNELFRTGKSTYVEVLMGHKGSLSSKLELIEVKKRQYNTMVNVYKALGGGWK